MDDTKTTASHAWTEQFEQELRELKRKQLSNDFSTSDRYRLLILNDLKTISEHRILTQDEMREYLQLTKDQAFGNWSSEKAKRLIELDTRKRNANKR